MSENQQLQRDFGVMSTDPLSNQKPTGTRHLYVPPMSAIRTSTSANPDRDDSAPDTDIFHAEPRQHLPVPFSGKKSQFAVHERLPHDLHHCIGLTLSLEGKAYAVVSKNGNPYVLRIGSTALNALIMKRAYKAGLPLKNADLAEINTHLESSAVLHGVTAAIWLRVAPIDGGIEIDVGDDTHARIRITAGKVDIVRSGSEVLFHRVSTTLPMAMPAPTGNWRLIEKYLNADRTDKLLLVAWISFVLAHPKVASTKFPILVLQGNEGSGKTSLCQNVIIRIIDPSVIGVQTFPTNEKDLAIAGLNAHVLCYDNLRCFKRHMADMLCIASTGGVITTRRLYTDADQQAIRLHVALVLNGIHQFIDQPDLAQRCLPIQLKKIEGPDRRSEQDFISEFEADLPAIMRGLLDLIAAIFAHLPEVEVTDHERMIDFVKWLGAMEKADGVPKGIYQGLYSHTLQQGQLDALMNNPLAAAIIEFTDRRTEKSWSGTPSELLQTLLQFARMGTPRSGEWPQNPIALSKRIASLQVGLLTQGIKIELTRGKHRLISIVKLGGN